MTTMSDPTNEQIRSELADAGVHTLDDFLDALRQMRDGGGPLAGFAPSGARVPAETGTPTEAPPAPQLALRVDGQVLSLAEAGDETLHLFVDASTFERGEVEAFTDPASVTALLREPQSAGVVAAPRHHIPGDQATAHFFEHANCQGASTSLDRRHIKWDLTQEWLGGILWWWTSWNDQISSVRTSGTHVVLFEHVNMQGATLTVARNTTIANLSSFGWNDRVSSIANEHWS